MTETLLELADVRQTYRPKGTLFSGRGGDLRAVDGVTLRLSAGETLGVVGESGCGKSTLARLMVGLETPTSGQVLWRGKDLAAMSRTERVGFHQEVQMIFQDPHASLDPRRTVGDSVAEGITTHRLLPAGQVRGRVAGLLQQVGLDPSYAVRYPHEFSGGQLQRIGIARALAVNPSVLVCDEPVSALDISVRAQVLNLLARLRSELDLAVVFIAHDLDVVQHVSDRIATMYLGKVVEEGACDAVYESAGHPYTRALLSAIPRRLPQGTALDRVLLQGDPPSPISPPPGCPFHTRCYAAFDACRTTAPQLVTVTDGHRSACHIADEVSTSRVGQPYALAATPDAQEGS